MLCGSEVGPEVCVVDNTWPGVWPIHYCHGCELYFLGQVPDADIIRDYYENDYWSPQGAMEMAKQLFRYFRVSSQCRYLEELIDLKTITGDCIEVGAADGVLIGSLSVPGKKVAIEQSGYYVERARAKFGLELENLDFLRYQSEADLFLMSHVVEHFSDPLAVMKHAADQLNVGGHLFVEVPNSPLQSEVDEAEFAEYLKTEHIVNFRVKSLATMAEKAGLEVVDIGRFGSRLPGFLHERQRKRLAKTLIGAGAHIIDLPLIAWYVLAGLIGPARSFAEIPVDAPYWGFGDNLRLLARKS